jgi:hypothetical protein
VPRLSASVGAMWRKESCEQYPIRSPSVRRRFSACSQDTSLVAVVKRECNAGSCTVSLSNGGRVRPHG